MTETASKTGAALGDVVDAIGADMSDALAGLQRNLDEVRGTLTSLVARIGDGAVVAGNRRAQQAREVARDFADGLADRAGDSAAALRGRIEDQPISSLALTFVGGLVAGAAIGVLLASGQSDPRRRGR